jgi:hypothetical protein
MSNLQQVLPLAKFAFEAQALDDLEARDDASLDLLAGFPGALANRPVFPARRIEVSRESVVLAGLQLRQQLLDCLLHLREFRNERLSVHLSCNIEKWADSHSNMC